MEQKDESFEDLLANLENSRVTIEKEREEIASYKQEIETLKNRLQQKEERFSEQKEKMLSKAREEAQKILQDAKDTADQTIRNINKLAKSSGVNKELEAERTKLRGKIQDVDKKLAVKKTAAPKKAVSAKKLTSRRYRARSLDEFKGNRQLPAERQGRSVCTDGNSALPRQYPRSGNGRGSIHHRTGTFRHAYGAVPAAPEAEAARSRCPSPSAYRQRST